MIETMSVEKLNKTNFDATDGPDNLGSLRYDQQLESEQQEPSSRSSNILFADVHSDSDGVLFRQMSENAASG